MGRWIYFFFLTTFLFAEFALASAPLVLITKKTSKGGYATVVGRAVSDSDGLIGISIDNGGARFSTIADASGQWAIVFPHTADTMEVRAWMVDDPKLVTVVSDKLPFNQLNSNLPWNKTLFAMSSAPTLQGARFQTMSQLNSQVRQHERKCTVETGWFDSRTYELKCGQWNNAFFRCTVSAMVYCRPTPAN